MAVKEAPTYPWYQLVKGGEVTQGDILSDCPLVVPNADDVLLQVVRGAEETLTTEIPVKKANLIVMTQACDIAQNKVESIVLCPIWTLDDFSKDTQALQTDKGKESLRRGHFPPFHLLAEDADAKLTLQVVDFRELYSLPTELVEFIAEKAGDRPRLLSPYREQLSQSFARYFMRVGLPLDIPSFVK